MYAPLLERSRVTLCRLPGLAATCRWRAAARCPQRGRGRGEAPSPGAGGTAPERQRPVLHVRQQPVADFRDVARELDFPDTELGPDYAVWMGDPDSHYGIRASVSLLRFSLLRFSLLRFSLLRFSILRFLCLLWRRDRLLIVHVLGRQVLAQAHERRLAQDAILRALGIGDFGDERGAHPAHAFFPRRIDERRIGALERPEVARQRAQQLLVEAGAYLAV